MSPIWVIQLGTGAKSFLDNPLIGSRRLNRLGLHRVRVKLAGALCAWRRRRLARHVRADWREAFDRDGFVAISDFVPPETFAALRRAILDYRGQAREMHQGDAVTRRLAIDPGMLAAIPELRQQLDRADLQALFHYVAGFRIAPLHYIQTIVTHHEETHVDPQEALHADAFHSSLKAWLFLNPVAPDEAPFTYVRGSHRLTPERMEWEYRRSLVDPREMPRLTGRGSPRVSSEDLAAMRLGEGEPLAVPGNTLVVADTIGFHARGASVRPVERVEIWSYARRNPFVPWLGGDLLSLPGIAERRVGWVWAARDRLAGYIGQPWKAVGVRGPADNAGES
ncbi:phytanoyl-CoA dioxygenase family protein [Novosphingobium sp. BL-8H]|uniref:phytanoyl-CoA dioxygenase family protein n=1 Tax=Novosphingobium sp. BL-8H TaxID=3127640 RepID=UPI0037582002